MRGAKARAFLAAALIGGVLVAVPGRAVAVLACPSDDPGCLTANDDFYKTTILATTAAHPLDIPAPGVLANDNGPHSTAVSVVDSDLTSFYGNATINWHGLTTGGGRMTYTPSIDPNDGPFTGLDTIDYEIIDQPATSRSRP